MITKRKRLALTFCLTVAAIAGVYGYWYVQPTPEMENPFVDPMVIKYGESVRVNMPSLQGVGQGVIYLQAETVSSAGEALAITPKMQVDEIATYSIQTYEGLPKGAYNIVALITYPLNPIKWVQKSVVVATVLIN